VCRDGRQKLLNLAGVQTGKSEEWCLRKRYTLKGFVWSVKYFLTISEE
jgi:hypothetical protein